MLLCWVGLVAVLAGTATSDKVKRQVYYPSSGSRFESSRDPSAQSTGHLPIAPHYPEEPAYRPEPAYKPEPSYRPRPQPSYKPEPSYKPKPKPSYKPDNSYEDSNTIPGEAGVDYPVFHEIPYTKFSCSDVPYRPGMYANPEAGCQVYHVCNDDRFGSQGAKFMCTNGTVFNQQTFTCDWWYNVDCSKATDYYRLNEDPVSNPYYQKPYEGPLNLQTYDDEPSYKPERPSYRPEPSYRPRPSYN